MEATTTSFVFWLKAFGLQGASGLVPCTKPCFSDGSSIMEMVSHDPQRCAIYHKLRPGLSFRFGQQRSVRSHFTQSYLVVEGIGKLGGQGLVGLTKAGSSGGAAYAVDQEEIITGAEDVVQAKLRCQG